MERVPRFDRVRHREDRRPVQLGDVGQGAGRHRANRRARRLEGEDPEGLPVRPVGGREAVEDVAREVLARVPQVADDVGHELRRVVRPLPELPVEDDLRPLPERVEDEEEEDGDEGRREGPLQGRRDERHERREGGHAREEEDDEGDRTRWRTRRSGG